MYVVSITVIAILSVAAFLLVFVKSGYATKLFVKFGIKQEPIKTNWTAFSWESCLRKLDCKADVVFFGDSIVRGGEFHNKFKHLKIVNLGCSGDTLSGMLGRVSMVQAVSPEKIFFLGGINGLTDHNILNCVQKYEELVNALHNSMPQAEIYVHSVLPISAEKEKHICKNQTIEAFNKEIEEIAKRKDLTFINIHSLYAHEGKLKHELTKDGIHLKPEAYELWENVLEAYLAKASETENL